MATRTAILAVRIVSDADQAAKSFSQTSKSVSRFERGIGKASRVAGAALAGLAVAGRGWIREAEASATANARLAQINKSMGQTQAGVTKGMIKAADALAKKTGINANEIKQGQAIIATFSGINNAAAREAKIFDRTTKAAVDLSAAGFGEVTDTSKQLGKALNDPIKGLSSLTRVGVTFTQKEQDKIRALAESGRQLDAQKLLLRAVEKQVSGTAIATANDTDKMAESWRQIQAQIGTALLPIIKTLQAVLARVAAWVQKNIGVVKILIATLAGLSVGVLAVNAAWKVYIATQRAAIIVTKAMKAAQKALNFVMKANPLVRVIALVAALVAIIIKAYKENETFRRIVQKAGRIAVAVFRAILEPVRRVIAIVRTAADAIRRALGPAFRAVLDTARDVGGKIRAAINRVLDVARKVGNFLRNALREAFRKVRETATAVFDAIKAPVEAFLDAINAIIDAVESLVGWISNIKWPEPPSWLKGGILGGIGLGGIGIFGASAPVTISTAASAPAVLSGTSTTTTRRAGTGLGTTTFVQINVNGALDPPAVARQISRILRDQGYRIGRS